MAWNGTKIVMLLLAIMSLMRSVNGECSGTFTEADGLYRVQYTVEGSTVNFTITQFESSDNRWIAIGFSTKTVSPYMFPADIVIGGVMRGTGFIEDRHTTGQSTPINDTTQNIYNTTVVSANSVLTLKFSRELITADTTGEDVPLNTNRVWIWAMGLISTQGDPVILQHSTDSRGTLNSGEPVSLSCQPVQQPLCSVGDVRLVNGPNNNAGAVEICNGSHYVGVCRQGWDSNDAAVICRQLKLTNQWADIGFFSSDNVNISSLEFNCSGYEANITLCSMNILNNCSSEIAAGVICGSPTPSNCRSLMCQQNGRCFAFTSTCDGYSDCLNRLDEPPRVCDGSCTEGDIRLVGGDDEFSGMIEVCRNGVFGVVCDLDFHIPDAVVVCRQAFDANKTGYPLPQSASTGIRSDLPISYQSLGCLGNETDLSMCPLHGQCTSSTTAAVVKCVDPEPCVDGEIQLTGTRPSGLLTNKDSIGSEGIVEQCSFGVYSFICAGEYDWNFENASVVCDQLGYDNESAIPLSFYDSYYFFGPGQGSAVNVTNCTTLNTAAAVMCLNKTEHTRTGCKFGDSRLIYRENLRGGIVEMCWNNIWRPLCLGSDGLSIESSNVICNNLGFNITGSENSIAFTASPLVPPLGPSLDIYLGCQGGEPNLLNCIEPDQLQSRINDTGSDGGDDCFNEYLFVQCPLPPTLVVVPRPDPSTLDIPLDEGREHLVTCNSDLIANFTVTKGVNEILNSATLQTSVNVLSRTHFDGGVLLSDAGFYNCEAINTTGSSSTLFNVTVNAGTGNYSSIILRLSMFINKRLPIKELTSENPKDALPYLEDFIFRYFPSSLDGVQAIDCIVVERQPIDYYHAYNRFQCRLTTFPFQSDFMSFARLKLDRVMSATDSFIIKKSFSYSEVGFCDFERTFTFTLPFDVYSWPETEVGNLVKQDCNFGNATFNGTASRYCGTNGWEAVNLDNCLPASFNNTEECEHGQLRLTGRASNASGILEICYSGSYGKVCYDNLWSRQENIVVACRHLGFNLNTEIVTPTALPASRSYLTGSGPIFLNGVFCQGTETSLIDCQYNPFGVHNCTHEDDIILYCEEFSPCRDGEFYCRNLDRCLTQDLICDGCVDCFGESDSEEENCPNRKVACTEGEVRLLGGPDKFSGVLTVCVNGALTLVCEEYFEYREANVICRQAGFLDRAGLIVDDGTYIADVYNFPFALGGLLCNGSEDNISKCAFHSNCVAQPPALPGSACCSRDNNKFITMSCIPSDNNCTDGDIRLVGGSTSSEGIVEMCLGGHYGYICQGKDSTDDKEGILTCEQLGYDPAGALPLNAIRSTVMFGESTGPPIVRNPECRSNTSLLDCVLFDLSNDEGEICDDFQLNFGVRCDDIPPTGCEEGDIRLVTRFQEGQGLVQICFNNTWYMLCRDTFGSNEAEVVCNQLGYVTNGKATQDGVSYPLALPKNSLSVKLDLSCSGNENNITDCITADSESLFVDQCKKNGSKFIEVTCPVPPVVGVFPMSKDGNYTLEVGRFKRIQCVSTTPGYVTITKTNETGSFTTIDFDSSFADDDFVNKIISSEDAGFYTCNVTSTAGFTRIVHINITVLVPEGPYSEVIVRFSALESFLNFVRGNVQTTLDLSHELVFLHQIPVEEPGIQTVECVQVTSRPEELSRNFLRVECSIRNYPPVNNTLELAQTAVIVIEDGVAFVCSNSLNFSAFGFCDYNTTTSSVGLQYAWPETAGGTIATLPCEHISGGMASRLCNTLGEWEEPDTAECDSLLSLEPTSFNDTYTFEVGRDVEIDCRAIALGEPAWIKGEYQDLIQPVPKDLLSSVLQPVTPNGNLSTKTDSSVATLISDPTIGATADDEDTYSCLLISGESVLLIRTIQLIVLLPEGPGSSVYLRLSALPQEMIDFFFKNMSFPTGLGPLEYVILNFTSASDPGLQIIKCVQATSRLIDTINNHQRIECNITQYPPMDSTINIAQKAADVLPSSIIKDIIIPESIVISGTVFCDAEIQVDSVLELQYYWPETIGGNKASTLCHNPIFNTSGSGFNDDFGSGERGPYATRDCSVKGMFQDANVTACINCGSLPAPTNGFIDITDTGFEDMAVYSCQTGYNLIGNNHRICQANATWSGQAPICQIVSCGSLSAPINGSIFITEVTFGALANFTCDEGFNLIGSSSRQCQANGNWSGNDTTCEIVDCGNLASPLFGTINIQLTTFGARVKYICNVGYNLFGSTTRQCLSNGTWSNADPTCQIVSCGSLSAPINGSIFITEVTFGALANFTCDEGFNLIGSSSRQCQANGNWSGNDTTCEIVDCGNLASPLFGSIDIQLTTFGARVKYNCNVGYNLFGSTTRQCLSNGTWSNAAPTCQIVSCGSLSAPINGSIFITEVTFGALANFTCDEGFNLIGSSSRQCQANGNWSGNDTTCEIVDCGNLASPLFGTINIQLTTFGARVKYICNVGYNLFGSTTRQCLSNGTWSNADPTCQIVSCGSLSAPINGSIFITEVTFGALANFTCDEGFNLIGSSSRQCQANGNWSGNDTTCEIVDCGNLASPLFGSIDIQLTTFGARVKYICNVGYNLFGSTTRQCLSNGTWSNAAPTCQIVSCGSLSAPINGSIFITEVTFGALANFTCDEGFNLIGSSSRQCQANGNWSGNDTTCEIVDCGNLASPLFGSIDIQLTTFGARVKYSCNVGYNLFGSTTRQCLSNGTWSNADPTCQIVSCGSLSAPINGSIFITEVTFGALANFTCDEGFNLIGSSSRQCQANGNWSGNDTTCEIVDCGNLASPLFGSIDIQLTTFGARVKYNCNVGYNLFGSTTRQCLSNGTWSNADPTCQIVSCGSLSAPINGSIFITEVTFGALANFTCDEGFNLIGSSSRQCQANGNWSGNDTTCEIVDCGNLASPLFGTINIQLTTFGARVKYNCNVGYNLFGSTTRQCLSNGTWSNAAPTCQIVSCGSLSAPINGSIFITEVTFGALANFTCDEGFNLIGSSSRQCQANGNWSGNDTTCEIVDCGNLASPLFGSIDIQLTTFGARVKYSCNVGYNLFGSTTRQCLSNGTWSNADPTCQIVSCGSLSAPINGSIFITEVTFGALANFTCDEGFNLIGSSSRQCQANGNWSGNDTTCEIVDCGNLASPLFGTINIQLTTFGARVKYICNVGYNLFGSTTRQCLSNGTWSNADPTCQIVSCGSLSAPINGSIFITEVTFGALANFTCDEGFNLIGSSSRQCQANGNWSGNDTTCEIVDCGNLASPLFGSIDIQLTTFGARVKYSCNVGYNLFGSTTRQCLSNGTWSNAAPTCQIVSCGSLSAPINGSIFITEVTFGALANFTCDEGFNLIGSSSRQCQANGNWSGNDTTCEIVDCGNLASPLFGSIDIQLTTFGARVKYSCNVGYNLFGSTTRQCLSNGTWSNAAPTCQIVSCGSLSAPINGSIIMTEMTFGVIANFTCDEGFNLIGSSSRQCQANGNWSGNDTTCEIVECGTLPDVANGTITYSGLTFGEKAVYSCIEGYNLTLNSAGSDTRMCQSDGIWSSDAPSCEIVNCDNLTSPTNGSLVFSSGTTFLSIATYSCDVGFQSNVSSFERVCQANKTWSGEGVFCHLVDCGTLTTPTNGTVDLSGGTVYQSIAYYSCNIRYKLSGAATRICQPDGTWSGNPPTCDDICSGRYDPPSNGSYEVKWTVHNEEITFIIRADYEWAGVGFTDTQSMLDSDIIIGAVDSNNQLSFLDDRFSPPGGPREEPRIDTQQDIISYKAEHVENKTVLTFTRNITTTDTSEDKSLDQCRYIIWATGPVTNYTTRSIQKHYIRGFSNTRICFPNATLCPAITCPNEMTNSIYWPTTIAGRTSTQPCFTTVPDGFKATRECDLFGRWSSPDVSDCKNAQPTLMLHPSGGVYNPEIQRQFVLSCQVVDGYPATNLTWLKKAIDDNEFVSVPTTTLVSVIPSISLVLTQRIVNNTVILETNLPGITTMADGEYLCRGENVFASSNISVNISAEVPSGPGMSTLLRATLAIPGFNNDGSDPFINVAIYTLEQEILRFVPESANEDLTVNCVVATRCLESLPKISINVQYVRLECNVTLYPPSSLFTTLKTAIQSIENITNNNFVELYEPIAIEVLPEPLMISRQDTDIPVQEGNYTVEIGRSRTLQCITNTTVVGSFSPVRTYWSSSRSNCTFISFSCQSGGSPYGKRNVGCSSELTLPNIREDQQYFCVNEGEFGIVTVPLNIQVAVPQGPGSSVIFEFEVSSSRRKRNVNDIADQLETLLINFIGEDFEGLQTVECTEIDQFQDYVLYRCNITTYPQSDSIANITAIVKNGIQSNQSGIPIRLESVQFGIGGFCQQETTVSELYGTHLWKETGGSLIDTTDCEFGAPFGRGSATAQRLCLKGGQWSEPDYSKCRDVLPELFIIDQEGNNLGPTFSINEGRFFTIVCLGDSVFGGDVLTWYKIIDSNEAIPVAQLNDFIDQAFTGNNGLVFSSGTTLDSFRQLYSSPFESQLSRAGERLTSYIYENATILPRRSIAGTYICEGRNNNGTRNTTITVDVKVASGDFSVVYIRATTILSRLTAVIDKSYQVALAEGSVLRTINVSRSGIQTVNCQFTSLRPFDIMFGQTFGIILDRIQCTIREYPPRTSTGALGEAILEQFRLVELIIRYDGYSNTSDTGFCDYEATTNPIYGNYTWSENIGGNTVITKCISQSDSNITRKCLTREDGWADIDFTACKQTVVEPRPYSIYIRFSANFTSIVPSGTPSSVLDNIRIVIELALPQVVEAICEEVPKRSGDNQERVECRVNGTSTQQITASRPGSITGNIISALLSQGYIVQATNITSDNGFCDNEIEDTRSPNRGQFVWQETATGMTTSYDCPFGPSGEVGTRTCLERDEWGTSVITSCATEITLLFIAINNTLSQINITIDNVIIITNNLTTAVNSATYTADQNPENFQIVTNILTQVAQLLTAPTTMVEPAVIETITIQTVQIVDDVEEWPQEVIQPQVNQIIHVVENLTQTLITQPNFTNITIRTEDIVIHAERVRRQDFNGRNFVAVTQDNGGLNVITQEVTGTDLTQNQTASISVPPTISSLLNDSSDITLAFTIYRDTSLFPVRRSQVVNVTTVQVVGSQVASIIIPGIPFGTALPEPVNITLRLNNPTTGTAENISNPVCVFWDFGSADGAGNWSSRGCRTITNDSKPYQVVCECDHLTNFACLVDISARTTDNIPPISRELRTTLEVVTYIGVVLSLVGLVATIITYLIFKKLRNRDVSKFHIQLSLALMFMLIVFVAGIDRTSPKIGCVITGALIHYFALAAIMWMGAEAVLMFQKLVIVFGTITWRYLLLVSIICWAVPLLPVIISVGVNTDFYITIYENSTNPGFCFISNQGVFFGAFLIPIFLVVIFNFIIYILVIRILIKHILDRNKRKSNKSIMKTGEAVKLLLSSVGIMCLFGLTWLFAVFTFTSDNSDVSFALQFVFSFFNAFQGFGIFLFFVVLSSDARDEWRGLLYKCFRIKQSSSKSQQYSSATKTTNDRRTSESKISALNTGKKVGTLEATFAKSEISSQDTIHFNSVAIEEDENLPDILELREKVLAEREVEKSSVNVPPPIINEIRPNNENEYVTLPMGGSTDEIKPDRNGKTKHTTSKRARVERHSTTRRTNQVEKAELDFFDDFSDDDDETIL